MPDPIATTNDTKYQNNATMTACSKRPRKDSDTTTDMSHNAPSLSPFGKEDILNLSGNAAFARGAFGELSIALYRQDKTTNSENKDENESSTGVTHYSFVAVKTIENAILSQGGNSATFGYQTDQSQHQKQQQQSSQLSRDVFNELVALQFLNPHPNIVPLVAVFSPSPQQFSSRSALSLVFEYSPIDIYQVLEWRRRNFQPPLSFSFISAILNDVLNAVAHCHRKNVIHRDIKPGNLLVSSSGIIQLCDFGLAKPFWDDHGVKCGKDLPPVSAEESSTGTKGLCTLYYRPPEVLLGGPAAHPAVDMYSTGTVLAELITGKPLWAGQNVLDQLALIFNALGTPNQTTWPEVQTLPDYGKLNFGTKSLKSWNQIIPRAAECPPLMEILSKLVVLNPKSRLTAEEALAMPGTILLRNEIFRKEMMYELIQPSTLQVAPVLFPDNRKVVSELALRLAKERRSFLSASEGMQSKAVVCGSNAQEASATLKSYQNLSDHFRKNYILQSSDSVAMES